MKVLSILKYVDMFGVEYNASIFSQRRYKTLNGAFLTIILFLLAVYKLKVIISQAFDKTDFTVTEERNILSGENQTITPFYLTVCSESFDNYSFQFNALVGRDESEIYPEYNITISEILGFHCYTYNISNSVLSAGIAESGFQNNTIEFQAIIAKDVLGSEESSTLIFYIDEAFIKRTDYYNPVRHKYYKKVISCISEGSYSFDIFLQTIQVKYKNTFNFGFLKYESISSQNFTSYYDHDLRTSDAFSWPGFFETVAVSIYHSDWITTYTFSGFELDKALSDFGGYINICFIIINIIGKLINNFLFQKYILEELDKKISSENLLRKESVENNDNHTPSKIESNNELLLIKSFGRMEDINHCKIKNSNSIENIKKEDIINYPNLQINQNITEDKDDSKIIIGANNKRFVNSPIIKRAEEEHDKKNDKAFKLYKNECDTIIEQINIEDELYNNLLHNKISKEEKEDIRKKINEILFEESMYYSYFYIICKELKLLELLVLNPDDAKLFIEYKNKLLDFNKLTILVNNKKIQRYIFSSRLYKEYALSKCII